MKRLSLIFGLFFLALPTRAWEFRFNGLHKSIVSYERLHQTGVYPNDTHVYTEQRLRLTQTLQHGPLYLEMANEFSGIWEQVNNSIYPQPPIPPNPAIAVYNDWMINPNLQVHHRLDRLFFQYTYGDVQWILGKQVVAIGVGHLFQAVSQTPRRNFVVIDPEFPMTEDAATLIWRGPFTMEARFLPRDPGQQGHNFQVRAKGSKGGYDAVLTAGRSDDKGFVGLETAGNLGDSVIRGELVGYHGTSGEWVQGLVGWDQVWNAKWSTEFEVFYNGFGNPTPGSSPTVSHRSAPYRNNWYAGNTTTLEISPRLKSRLITIVNLADPSALFHLNFAFSLSSNSEIQLGQYLGVSSTPTGEFGGKFNVLPPLPLQLGLPDMTYALIKFYF